METRPTAENVKDALDGPKNDVRQAHHLRWIAEANAQLLQKQLSNGQEPVAEVVERPWFGLWKRAYLHITGDLKAGMKLYASGQPCPQCATLKAEIETAERRLEVERIRLSACGVAAMANTRDTVKARITRDNPYWSESYGDVCRAVDEEIRLREENAQLREQIPDEAPIYLTPEQRQPIQDDVNRQARSLLDKLGFSQTSFLPPIPYDRPPAPTPAESVIELGHEIPGGATQTTDVRLSPQQVHAVTAAIGQIATQIAWNGTEDFARIMHGVSQALWKEAAALHAPINENAVELDFLVLANNRIAELTTAVDRSAASWAKQHVRLLQTETALRNLLEHYTNLINSGDAGNWDPETEPVVIDARAALSNEEKPHA